MVNKEEKPKKGSFHKKKREKSEFEQKVIDIARVTRVVKGGKRFSFRTTIVIGDKKGRVGVGVAKGPDMKASTEKSFAQAKKNLVTINFKGNTIPYPVRQKIGSAIVLLKPAAPGRGIVAGGAVRSVIALVGISDITAKMLGAKNKLNNARATIEALETFSVKTVGEIKKAEKKETLKAQKVVDKKEEKESADNKAVTPKKAVAEANEVSVVEKKTAKAEKETKK
jgi:small subunit ribosomal protein S5